MWNEPKEHELRKIPRLYETRNVDLAEKIIYLHFFLGGCDWYIAEYDGEDLFFGYTILNNDYMNAEWGYISFRELREIDIGGLQIDRDVWWEPCKAGEVDKIVESDGACRIA